MPTIPVHAVYPHGRYLSAKTRTLIDFLAERFANRARLEAGRHDNGADRVEVPRLRAAV
jgi:hypothetical protein